jgi:hypothetical protein
MPEIASNGERFRAQIHGPGNIAPYPDIHNEASISAWSGHAKRDAAALAGNPLNDADNI